MRYVDTHCHLNITGAFPDLDDAIRRATDAGVDRMLVVGIDEQATPEALRLAAAHKGIWAIVGIHPTSATRFGPREQEIVEQWLKAPRVVAVGETGIDLYHKDAPLEDQERAFRWHIRKARELDLPLVIHCRDAHAETVAILESEGGTFRGVFHCFSGTQADAERALNLGFHLGVDGPITYKSADSLREVVRSVPLDRILLETDCPFLPPVPYRGKRCEPSYIPLIAAGVAAAHGETVETVVEATTSAAQKLFRLAG